MKIAYLTAGAGGMYCGSCMRDNALASALIRQGRDVVLIPVFTPIRTDETDVSAPDVFYGGINVYLQQKSGFFRHAHRLLDKILDSRSLLKLAMRGAGSSKPEELGEMTASILRGPNGAQRRELEKLIDGLMGFRPDVVHLPDAFFVGAAKSIKDALGATVVCTLTGEDIFIDKLNAPHRAEVLRLIREAGRDVDGFLLVSKYYADYAAEHFGVPHDRMRHVPLGIHLDGADSGDHSPVSSDGEFTIGYLARVCHDKGLHLLCDALAILREQGRACRVVAAGYLGASDRPYFEALEREIARRGLRDHFQYLGEVDRDAKFAFLRSLHLFSVPSVYREAKGLYLLEALSQGVPAVQPRHGSFPEIIEATGGGLLYEPGDVKSLAAGIAKLMDDSALRTRLGDDGRRRFRELYTAEIMAESAWNAITRFAGRA